MSAPKTPLWNDAEIEQLLGPFVGALAPPTSLSPLPHDLNAGVPDRSTLPAEELARAAERALHADPAGALTYGGAQGYEPLRAWIAEEHPAANLRLGAEHVTLCSGSAHAIDNIAAAFLGPGDTVVVGAPSYPGAIRAFRARGARLVDVPQDGDGLRTATLATVLEQQQTAGTPAKLIYAVPTYDNPTGSTMPIARREELLRLAAAHRALIVEDDAYAGLDLDGPPPPSLFALAEGRGVLQIGTASKTIATGIRVGWVIAAPNVVRTLVFTRLDNGASPLLQRTVLNYLQGGTHDAHVAKLRCLYRERRDAAAAALREQLNVHATFELPSGGFYLWLRLAERLRASAVVEAAQRRGVAITPGALYFANKGGEQHLRLAYSAIPAADLAKAITILGQACAEATT